MKREMFGYRSRKSQTKGDRSPGKPVHEVDSEEGKAKDNPPNYEGKEHMKYKNPGFSKHNIRYPEDEPHMRGKVSKEESHRMEDDYHMDTPDQTYDTLAAKIPRARMNMDMPNQEDPKPLQGNMVTQVPYEGVQDEDGEEDMGPNYMQGSGGEPEGSDLPKEDRKKMIVAVMKRKMKK